MPESRNGPEKPAWLTVNCCANAAPAAVNASDATLARTAAAEGEGVGGAGVGVGGAGVGVGGAGVGVGGAGVGVGGAGVGVGGAGVGVGGAGVGVGGAGVGVGGAGDAVGYVPPGANRTKTYDTFAVIVKGVEPPAKATEVPVAVVGPATTFQPAPGFEVSNSASQNPFGAVSPSGIVKVSCGYPGKVTVALDDSTTNAIGLTFCVPMPNG
jgi:hypothetical protein